MPLAALPGTAPESPNTPWWIAVLPGGGLMLTVLLVSLGGDQLRDALDPTLRTVT